MKVAIAGARGFVGRELARQMAVSGDVLALGRDDLDITNPEHVSALICDECPDLVINCAVIGVDACEIDPALANSVNVVGSRNLAEAAAAIDAEFIQFSTNYVFDGARVSGFYTIDDIPSPLNVYGRTKLAGEQAVIAANARSFVVRTSWVFGNGKENFIGALPKSLGAGKRVRAITDIFANATYVQDLGTRVKEIAGTHRYGVYHVVNSGVCSFAESAFEVARLLGLSQHEVTDLIATSELRDFEFAASRPRYTPMACKLSEEIGLAPMRDWRMALAEYVDSVTEPLS